MGAGIILVGVSVLFGAAAGQNYANSTAPSNITAYRQAYNNFTQGGEFVFPCNQSKGTQRDKFVDLDLENTTSQAFISAMITSVFEYFLYSTYPLTGCAIGNVPNIPIVDVSQACMQSTSPGGSTKYALEFQILYLCEEAIPGITANTLASLQANISLPSGLDNNVTESQVENRLVIEDVWFDDIPQILALNSTSAFQTRAAGNATATANGTDQGDEQSMVVRGFSVDDQVLSMSVG